MFVFGTYKQLPAGLMQAEQEITSAGQESHSKVCHPMDERSCGLVRRMMLQNRHWPSTPLWAVAAAAAAADTSGQEAWLIYPEPRAEKKRFDGYGC